MQPIPVARYLVPDATTVAPEGFTRVDSQLRRGLPHAIGLSASERLLLIAPVGVAVVWREVEPGAVVAAAEFERQPRADGRPLSLVPPWRLPVRLLYQVNNRTVAVAPLVAGTVQRLPEAAGASARLELVVLDWRLHAGTLRGAGDYGSFVSLAWRAADAPVSAFSEPPLNPVFVARQPPERRMQSDVGRKKGRLRKRRRDKGRKR